MSDSRSWYEEEEAIGKENERLRFELGLEPSRKKVSEEEFRESMRRAEKWAKERDREWKLAAYKNSPEGKMETLQKKVCELEKILDAILERFDLRYETKENAYGSTEKVEICDIKRDR